MEINLNNNAPIAGLLDFLRIFESWEEISAIEVSEAFNSSSPEVKKPELKISYWTSSGIRCRVSIRRKSQEIFLQTPDRKNLQKKLENLTDGNCIKQRKFRMSKPNPVAT